MSNKNNKPQTPSTNNPTKSGNNNGRDTGKFTSNIPTFQNPPPPPKPTKKN